MYSPHEHIILQYSFEHIPGSDQFYTPQGLPLHPLESLRARDLHTESFQSLRNPFDFLVERGL